MYAVRGTEFRQYDGNNSAALVDWLNNASNMTVTITSEVDDVLTLFWNNGDGAGPAVLSVGDWVSKSGMWVQVIPSPEFDEQWVKVVEA